MSDNKIQCKKCKKRIPRTKEAMWKHAIKEHWDTVFESIGNKVEANDKGTDGLYNIGHALGKQMQMDGMNIAGVMNSITTGLSQKLKRLK